MSLFACAIHAGGGRVPESVLAGIEASPLLGDREISWCSARGFVGAVAIGAGAPSASVARLGPVIAVGDMRLDNREEIARWLCCRDDGANDLELALRFVTRDHGARIGMLLGDFAFVVWDPTSRSLVAARDSLGVRQLFHAEPAREVVVFASRASLLADGDRYDVRYLIDRIAQRAVEPTRTTFAGVAAIPPAGMLHRRNGASATTTFWSAAEAQATAAPPRSPAEQIDAFRSLLVDAVRFRVTDRVRTWSQLSGGLDSSSVVSVAQWLAARGAAPSGLAGTVTYTDDIGTGADEREYSDAVVRHYGLRNELVPHRADAVEIMRDPPPIDQPDLPLAVAIRDLAAARIVSHAGGSILLTGEGGDALVAGTMFFFADWLVSGRGMHALREMAHRAALGRVSFWQLAYENAVLPLLPVSLRSALTRTRRAAAPPWIRLTSGQGATGHAAQDAVYDGRRGRKYGDAVAITIAGIPYSMPLGPADELIERRHPYLHRPLVELALQLPPEMCVRPHARKWILREAMRGILPEMVRTRVGKGSLDGLNLRSVIHDRTRVDRLLRDPILAQLGCVEPRRLRRALDELRSGHAEHCGWHDRINATLEVEMWLQLRSGRWAARDTQSTRTTNTEVARLTGTPLPNTHSGASP